MGIKTTRHAVYDIKYHFVWVPKYRKWIMGGEIGRRVKELFKEIAGNSEMEIDTMEVMEDHVHLFLSAPPRYSPSKIVNVFKAVSSKKLFEEFPLFRKEAYWGGEFWNDGYFVRTVGDKVTADVIRKYIEYQHKVDDGQLELF